MAHQLLLQSLDLTFQLGILSILGLSKLFKFGYAILEAFKMSFLTFAERSLSRPILSLTFLLPVNLCFDDGQITFAGSVIIIFLPGFFFGFASASSDPDSMAPELADSKSTVSEPYHIIPRLSGREGN